MRSEEVVEILVAPVSKSMAKPENLPADLEQAWVVLWSYGSIFYDHCAMNRELYFVLALKDNVVVRKDDPFGGAWSADGSPTPARLLVPNADAEFSHYPRWIDLRWLPAAGDAPMRYELEIVGIAPGALGDAREVKLEQLRANGDVWHEDRFEVTVPVYTELVRGQGQYVWRVRAVNDRGSGEWSGFRMFSFRD